MTETGEPHRCQCLSNCTKQATKGNPFCEEHMKGCPRASPLSGCEPKYDPTMWNKKRSLRETHNCFSYAMNVNDPKQVQQCMDNSEECEAPFHQPGSAAGYKGFSSKRPKTCPNMLIRILGDNPDMIMSRFESRCPVNMSKIALVVDPKEDYHFLRQDSNGLWSHKAGARPVKNVDALGHMIWDPQLANFNYYLDGGDLNYTMFCSYLCAPRMKGLYLLPGGGGSRNGKATSLASPAKPFRTRTTRGRS